MPTPKANLNLYLSFSGYEYIVLKQMKQTLFCLGWMPGFHWMTGYGDYLQEVGYALRRVGIDWDIL